jgi:hypothetical protein
LDWCVGDEAGLISLAEELGKSLEVELGDELGLQLGN